MPGLSGRMGLVRLLLLALCRRRQLLGPAGHWVHAHPHQVIIHQHHGRAVQGDRRLPSAGCASTTGGRQLAQCHDEVAHHGHHGRSTSSGRSPCCCTEMTAGSPCCSRQTTVESPWCSTSNAERTSRPPTAEVHHGFTASDPMSGGRHTACSQCHAQLVVQGDQVRGAKDVTRWSVASCFHSRWRCKEMAIMLEPTLRRGARRRRDTGRW